MQNTTETLKKSKKQITSCTSALGELTLTTFMYGPIKKFSFDKMQAKHMKMNTNRVHAGKWRTSRQFI